MSEGWVFVAFNKFLPITITETICEGKDAWELAKGNVVTDIFHGLEPPGNPIKWFDLRLQAFR